MLHNRVAWRSDPIVWFMTGVLTDPLSGSQTERLTAAVSSSAAGCHSSPATPPAKHQVTCLGV